MEREQQSLKLFALNRGVRDGFLTLHGLPYRLLTRESDNSLLRLRRSIDDYCLYVDIQNLTLAGQVGLYSTIAAVGYPEVPATTILTANAISFLYYIAKPC